MRNSSRSAAARRLAARGARTAGKRTQSWTGEIRGDASDLAAGEQMSRCSSK
jgi:hypothetical protein